MMNVEDYILSYKMYSKPTRMTNMSMIQKGTIRHLWLQVINSKFLKSVNVSMARFLLLGHFVRDYISETQNRKLL